MEKIRAFWSDYKQIIALTGWGCPNLEEPLEDNASTAEFSRPDSLESGNVLGHTTGDF